MSRRPQITVSFAQSLDGRVATRTGHSQWISGAPTLDLAHQLRDRNDAILVGVGTVLADNPQLTCRIAGGHSPVRVVRDTSLRTPPESVVAQTATSVPTLLFASPAHDPARARVLEEQGVEIITAAVTESGLLDLERVFEALSGRGIGTLLIEGGQGVITSVLRHSLCDRMIVVMAPMVIGEGVSSVGELGVDHLTQAVRGRTVHVEQMGQDVVWEVEF